MRNDDQNGIPKLPLFADLSRRDLLRLGAMGGAGMALGNLWFLPAFAAQPNPAAKAKAVIQIPSIPSRKPEAITQARWTIPSRPTSAAYASAS